MSKNRTTESQAQKSAKQKKSKGGSTTIFDDVFRTMVERMPELLIPLINEVFHTDYADDEPITQYRNEHQTKSGRKITDAHIGIGMGAGIGIRDRRYHFECESNLSDVITVRMVEYDLAIALDDVKKTNGGYEMSFPRSCVLFLRHNANTPDALKVKISFPGGEQVTYRVPTMKAQAYTEDEIFQKRLLFLLPFYVMRYEKQLKQIEQSDERSAAFIAEFADIRRRLDEKLSDVEQRDTYTRLMELTQQVCDYELQKQQKLQEGVRKTMGGQVLELKTDKIIAQRERAEKQGLKQGRLEGKIEMIMSLHENNYPVDQIARVAKMTESKVEKIIAERESGN